MKETFKTLLEERYQNSDKIQKILKNIQTRLERRLPEGQEPSLTTFQKKAISEPRFWQDWNAEVSHLMIQGATSAGKTLLSELNILDTLRNDKKAIVLVPLKAMVRERTAQFREDMVYNLPDYELKVFGSSSDYMENDERLINGDYDVAIIVYEKFFSLLSQGYTKLMNDCALLVVDELSMLSADQRGPKLEMALEIVRKKYEQTRIMCMVTCDCSTEKVCRWLDIDEPIVSTARPVALEEHILELNGKGIYRQIPADHECVQEEDAPEKLEEKIEIPGYEPDWRQTQKSQALLLSVLRGLYDENPDARVLVFSPSKRGASILADFLNQNQSKWYPDASADALHNCDEEFLAALSTCDRDEGQEKLIDELIPNGIAYHHAGISTTLRELIEEQFSKPHSNLRVIVATETLTIGVNMPFDAMIITNYRVPHGVGDPVPLTQQEYRNYIGRAGRLGQSKNTGKTYLFVDNSSYRDLYWNSYFNRNEVQSALTKADEKKLAPYYLSILNNSISGSLGTTFTLRQLENLFQDSLSKFCGKKSFDAEGLYKNLYVAYLANEIAKDDSDPRDRVIDSANKYEIERFGQHMAPYAFTIDTCRRIYKYFYEGYRRKALPLSLTRDDIKSDRYLLDILYHVCCHDEIASSSNLSYPIGDTNPSTVYEAKRKVIAQLRKILSETDESGNKKYLLWSDLYEVETEEATDSIEKERQYSDLWMLLNSSNLNDEAIKLQAAMRAVILFYWTKGYTTREIRKITEFHNFKISLVTGDIERLAEVASFHLDAIQKCLATAWDPKTKSPVYKDYSALKEFYALQTRVKYGMPRDLVIFANKHIHGLDRKRLLDLSVEAKKAGLSPMQYLYVTPPGKIPASILTTTQLTQLRQSLERRSAVDSITTLKEIIANDLSNDLTSGEIEWLTDMFGWKGYSEDKTPAPIVIYDGLKACRENTNLDTVEIYTDRSPCSVLWKTGNKKLFFGILCDNQKNDEVSRFFSSDLQSSRPENKARGKILIVPEGFTDEEKAEAMRTYGATAVLDNVFLAFTLAKTISNSLFSGEILTDFFADLRGIFTKADHNFFPLSHYVKSTPVNSPKFRVIFGNNFCRKEEKALTSDVVGMALGEAEDLENYEILPWGESLTSGDYDLTECPTIMLLNRQDVIRSYSLTYFVHTMRNQSSRNCLLLLDSEETEQEWNSSDAIEEYGCNLWSNQFNKIRKNVAPDIASILREIREMLKEWKHVGYLIGISYSHYVPDAPEADSGHKNDDELLAKLSDLLREEYGEDRILYDRFNPARKLFDENRGKEKSLNAYRECRFYLILWNHWTKEAVNCKSEREIILERCQDDSCKCMFLQSGNPNDPIVPEAYYSCTLSENSMEETFKRIKELIDGLL